MTRMLKHYIDGKNHSWAIRWSYAMYKQDKFSIYPKLSKIQNIGFDKRATHCKGVNIYKTKLDNREQCDFIFTNNITPHGQISKDFKYQYSYTNKLIKNIKGYIERFKNET